MGEGRTDVRPGAAPRTAPAGPLRLLLAGPGGAVRVAGAVSLLVAAVARGPVDAALFALVVAGLVVPVVVRVPSALDAAHGVGLLAAAWAAALGLYRSVAWLDVAAHLVVTGLVAAVALLALVRATGAVVAPSAADGPAERTGVVLVTCALGLALSVLWEVGEYVGHTYLDPTIYVTYADTVGDLVAGGLGSAVAGLVLVGTGRRAPG